MYKKWLYKVLISFLLSLTVVSVLYKFMVINRVYGNIDYAVPVNIKNVFIGASHFEVGVDDALLEDTANYSISGMPYYFAYPKVKNILENNKQIEKIFVSLSPIHIGPYGDDALLSDQGLSREEAFRFFPFLKNYDDLGHKKISLDFVLAYAKYNLGVPFNYMDDVKYTLISFKRQLRFFDFGFAGKYKPDDRNSIDIKTLKKKAEFYFGHEMRYSKLTTIVIERVAQLAQDAGVELYIVNMPVYEEFRSMVPEKYVAKQKNVMASMQTKYPNLRYLDYYALPMQSTDFLDGDHLNSSGAQTFTKKVLQDLLKG